MDLLKGSNFNDLFTNTVYQLYADASFSGASGSNVFFSFCWPLNVLEESAYQNPWSPANTQGSMLVVENISELVDTIPALDEYYTPSGNTVSDIYGLIVSGYTLPPGAQPAAAAEKAIGSVTDIMDLDLGAIGVEMLQANSPLGKIIVANPIASETENLETERQQANETARQRAASLTKAGAIIDSIGTAVFNEVHAVKDALLKTFTVPGFTATAQDGGNSLNTIFAKANALFTNTILASIKNPQLDFHASSILPGNFADDAAAAEWPVASLQYSVTSGSITENVQVSYKFCRVDIQRPWMIGYLLSMQGWGIQSQPKGWLSTGSAQNNNGVFPLLPVSLILCRDLMIKSDSGDLNYNAPGLQVIAYVNTLIAYMPTLG